MCCQLQSPKWLHARLMPSIIGKWIAMGIKGIGFSNTEVQETTNRTSWLVFTAGLHPQFRTPPVPNAPELRSLHAAGSIRISRQASCCCSSAIAGIAIGANFKIYLLRQFGSNWVQSFLQYTGDTEAKNRPEFWNSNSVIFENFLKFSKRCRAVPLRPIWTIMVAAKLDHRRVLVTKFHQNRSMLKGRSAGHRHTDRQTRLQIMALQVCNRANKELATKHS